MIRNVIILVTGLVMVLQTVFCGRADAKIDLAALTDRGSVQTTIYRKADLTLVRDRRILNLREGMNYLQFSWANTRIDPTSLSIDISNTDSRIEIVEISYPAGTKDLGLWHIKADKTCQATVDITYFTSGLAWASYYTVILSADLETCSLINHVDITNHSGEDYADAKTRLVVGTINLLDDIRALSDRQYPYGQPEFLGGLPDEHHMMYDKAAKMLEAIPAGRMVPQVDSLKAPKEISKQSLSEYFLYSIEGRETIQDGWTKRLLSFQADNVKIKNVYRLDENRYGNTVIRFVTLKNDKKNQLGTTPLPDGRVTVFAARKGAGELEYIGSDSTRYIPIGNSAELNLGMTMNVKIEPRIMKYRKKNLSFDKEGNLNGFDDIKTVKVRFSNTTNETAVCEYTLRMETPDFEISDVSEPNAFTRQDQKTLVFKMKLVPGKTRDLEFTLTTQRGERRWQQ